MPVSPVQLVEVPEPAAPLVELGLLELGVLLEPGLLPMLELESLLPALVPVEESLEAAPPLPALPLLLCAHAALDILPPGRNRGCRTGAPVPPERPEYAAVIDNAPCPPDQYGEGERR